MQSAERPQFRAQIERVARVFERQLTEPLLDDYWQALRHLSLAALTARVDAHIRVGKFFPKPRDLLENPDGERRVVDTRSPDVDVDDWTMTLNRIAFAVLSTVHGIPGTRSGNLASGYREDSAQLRAFVAEKNRIAAQMREASPSREEWAEMLPAIKARLFDLVRGKVPEGNPA